MVDARFEAAAEIFRALAAIKITSEAQLRAYVDAVFPALKKKAAEVEGAQTLASLLARPVATRESGLGAEGAPTEETKRRIHGEIQTLFEGGRGNALPGVAGTAWGLYNAVTEYQTHEQGGTRAGADSRRLERMWLGGSGPVAEALPAAMEQFLGVARA